MTQLLYALFLSLSNIVGFSNLTSILHLRELSSNPSSPGRAAGQVNSMSTTEATTEDLVSATDEWLVGADSDDLIMDRSLSEGVDTTTAAVNITLNTLNPEYYSPAYRAVGTVLVGIIFVVGLVGNVLVVAVVTRTRSMHTPTNWYLVSLAVADILLLVSAPLPTLIEYHLLVDQWVLGRPGCSAMVFAQYLGVNVSSLSITAFTVERYIIIIIVIKLVLEAQQHGIYEHNIQVTYIRVLLTGKFKRQSVRDVTLSAYSCHCFFSFLSRYAISEELIRIFQIC